MPAACTRAHAHEAILQHIQAHALKHKNTHLSSSAAFLGSGLRGANILGWSASAMTTRSHAPELGPGVDAFAAYIPFAPQHIAPGN